MQVGKLSNVIKKVSGRIEIFLMIILRLILRMPNWLRILTGATPMGNCSEISLQPSRLITWEEDYYCYRFL